MCLVILARLALTYVLLLICSLILACKYRPLPILKQALYLLHPSCPFVIFHEFMEPLVDCYLYLQQNNLALRLVLSDTWMREFQTLPGRVRPDMFMSTSGGFLLTGVYVGMVPCAYPFAPAVAGGTGTGRTGDVSCICVDATSASTDKPAPNASTETVELGHTAEMVVEDA
jgi:hypothetical protein